MTRAGTGGRAEQRGHEALTIAGRVGYAAYGVIHVLIGILALRIAWGGGGRADQTGALGTIAQEGWGKALLWLFVVGFAGLALVEIAKAVGLRGGEHEATDKAKSAGRAVLFAVLAVLSQRFASGGSGGGGGSDATATVLGWPGGRLLVGAAGLAIIGFGAYHAYKGVTKKFREELDPRDLSGPSGRVIERIGVVGHLAKAVALALVGGLVVLAAVRFDPAKANGLDTALRTLVDQPFGPYLLTLVALGIIAFGVYLFVRARRGKV